MEEPRRHRVFIDANVLIRGVTFPRFPYEVLRLAARHEIVLVLSPSVLDDVRYYVGELFPNHVDKLEAFLATALVEIVGEPAPEEVKANHDLVRDIDDVPVVLAAAKAKVDFLVSTDADLTDVDASTEKLRQMLAPGKVMKVGSFLDEVMGWTHETLEAVSRRRWEDVRGEIWSSEERD
jgi:putative PIN family toxin of toxin-antitoxin system